MEDRVSEVPIVVNQINHITYDNKSFTLARAFEAQFHRNFDSFVQVTAEVAEGVVDLVVLSTPVGIAIFGWLTRKADSERMELPPIVLGAEWQAAFEAFQQTLLGTQPSPVIASVAKQSEIGIASASLGTPPRNDGRTLSVVLSAENPLAQFFYEPSVVRALLGLKESVEVKVASPDHEFKRKVEERVIHHLSAVEKGKFSRIFKIRPEPFSTFAPAEASRGAGVLVDSQNQLNELDHSISAIVANLSELKPEEGAKLVLPILLVAAKLGALANGRQLTALEAAALRVKLLEAWESLGFSISVEEGRIVGTVLAEAMREWFAAQKAQSIREIAA